MAALDLLDSCFGLTLVAVAADGGQRIKFHSTDCSTSVVSEFDMLVLRLSKPLESRTPRMITKGFWKLFSALGHMGSPETIAIPRTVGNCKRYLAAEGCNNTYEGPFISGVDPPLGRENNVENGYH